MNTIFNCTIVFIISGPMTVVTTLAIFSLQLIISEIIGAHLLAIATIFTISITNTVPMTTLIGAIGAIGLVGYSSNIGNICLIEYKHLASFLITLTHN